jgi:hypothetical protein
MYRRCVGYFLMSTATRALLVGGKTDPGCLRPFVQTDRRSHGKRVQKGCHEIMLTGAPERIHYRSAGWRGLAGAQVGGGSASLSIKRAWRQPYRQFAW